MNLLSKMTDSMGQDVLYNYDLEGRLTKEIDRNGQEIVYSYNSDSHLILKNAVGGTGGEPTTPEGQGKQGLYQKYLYNLDGSLLAAINSENVDKYLYTANGNLYQKYHNGQLEIEYGYNKNGSISRVKDKTNAETNYTYDTVGRLKTVKDGLQQLAQYNYNVDSTINQIIYSTGVNVSYNYDRDKNITSLINKNQQGNIISDFIYTYDNNGNQKSKTENGEVTNYTYDKLNRLEAVQYPTAGIESYTYDNAGNRLSKSTQNTVGGMTTLDITTTYVYDALNRVTESQAYDIILSSKTKTTYGYDGNGNLLTEATTNIDPQTGLPLPQIDQNTGQTITDPITGQPLAQQPQTKKYTYNAFNQTTSVTNPEGSFQQNFYDALGMRIGIVENGVRSDFIFDRGSIIAEFDGSGTLTNRNIRGYGLIAQKDTKGRLNYYLHNAHGDVTSLINPAGEILNTYHYDAFGNTTSYVETIANRFRYAGEQLDDVTGQYYLRARYYDPQVGRFTQEDTFRGDGLNLYAYVGNNPVNFVDPSGYCKDDYENTKTSGFQPVLDVVGSVGLGLISSVIDNIGTSGVDVVTLLHGIFDSNTAQRMYMEFQKDKDEFLSYLYSKSSNDVAFYAGRVVGDALITTAGVIGLAEGINKFVNGAIGAFVSSETIVGAAVSGSVAVVGAIQTAVSLNAVKNAIINGKEDTRKLVEAIKRESGSSKPMFGENGTKFNSETLWQRGKTERVDVENPAPGKRPEDIHYHEPNNKKWRFDTSTKKFYDPDTGDLAPNKIQKLLERTEIQKAINKGLKYLGEQNVFN